MNQQPVPNRSLPVSALMRVLAGGILISFSAVFVKLTQVGPSTSAFYRVLFGGLALLVVAVIRRDSFRAGPRIWKIIFFASLFFALDLEAWHRAIFYIGPGLATILGNFQVFVLAIVGILLYGEQRSKRLIFALPLAIIGLWLLVGCDQQALSQETVFGLIMGIITALCYSLYILILRSSQHRQDKLNPVPNMAVISLGTAAFCLIFNLFQEEVFIIPTFIDGGYLLAYGIFCQALGWLLLSTALPQLPASIAGLLLLIQPTCSFLWDILLFKRPTGPVGLLGAFLTICAIWAGISGQQAANRQDVKNDDCPDFP